MSEEKILEMFQLQQQQINQILGLLTKPPALIQQERVPPEDENLLEIAPAPSNSTEIEDDSPVLDNSVDVQEELVEEESEVVIPKIKKDTSLIHDGEILEEGESGRGNRACVRVPLSTGPRKNRFKDNPSFAKVDTLKFDKVVRTEDSIKAHDFIEKRPPAVKMVVRCRECNRQFRIDAKLAPQRVDVGDTSSYQCDSCILRRKG